MGRGKSSIECDPVGAVGVSLGVQDGDGVGVGTVPGVVPTGTHVKVEGFGGSCTEECVLEVAESDDGIGLGDAETAMDLAEGTKLVAVRVLACGADGLAAMDNHLLCKGCAAWTGSGLHLPGIVAVKEGAFPVGIDECSGIPLAAEALVVLAA